jgi:Glycosyl hydrolases family 43
MKKLLPTLLLSSVLACLPVHAENPIITKIFTADPAAMVTKDEVFIYAGQDEAGPNRGYTMRKWVCFSSKDMKTWMDHGSLLAVSDFKWAKGDAWASQVIEKDGKFYWYVTVTHDDSRPGKAIGVAVADSPTGPFKDAIGAALVTDDMTPDSKRPKSDIDPTVFIDDDGTPYLCWGNGDCFFAKLKANMIELDGPIQKIEGLTENYTEAPWLHKRGNLYYLSFATGFPESISYATAPSIKGPWTFRGLVTGIAGNSNTIHQAIINFKGQDYFIYHNGGVQAPNTGGSYRRSVCVDYLYYNPDGTIKRVIQTPEGTDLPPVK